MNPEIVSVVRARETERVTAIFANGIFEAVFVHGVHIEGRIGEDKVKAVGALVQVFVIGVRLADQPPRRLERIGRDDAVPRIRRVGIDRSGDRGERAVGARRRSDAERALAGPSP